jgi:hypothetical protein
MIPKSLLEVLTPMASAGLVDRPTLKSDLGISDTSQDSRLDRIILTTAQRIAGYVGYPLIEQEYRETWRLPPGGQDYWSVTLPRDQVTFLPLSRFPVTVVEQVSEAGTVLDPSLYSWIDTKGLQRLDAAGGETGWASGIIQVKYKAGWIGAKNSTSGSQVALPDDLYEAAMDAARADFLAKDRDPGLLVRSENVPNVYQVEYDTRTGFGGEAAQGPSTYGLPPRIMGVLENYRRSTFAF